MRSVHNALITTAVITLTALTASAADAQYAARPYGAEAQYAPQRYGADVRDAPLPSDAYDYDGGASSSAGTFYSYGADRADPSLGPNGWDLAHPRDFQLQGTR